MDPEVELLNQIYLDLESVHDKQIESLSTLASRAIILVQLNGVFIGLLLNAIDKLPGINPTLTIWTGGFVLILLVFVLSALFAIVGYRPMSTKYGIGPNTARNITIGRYISKRPSSNADTIAYLELRIKQLTHPRTNQNINPSNQYEGLERYKVRLKKYRSKLTYETESNVGLIHVRDSQIERRGEWVKLSTYLFVLGIGFSTIFVLLLFEFGRSIAG